MYSSTVHGIGARRSEKGVEGRPAQWSRSIAGNGVTHGVFRVALSGPESSAEGLAGGGLAGIGMKSGAEEEGSLSGMVSENGERWLEKESSGVLCW